MKKLLVLLLTLVLVSGCTTASEPSTSTEGSSAATFQQQCSDIGVEVVYEDPNAPLAAWKATIAEETESDLVADFDTMAGASLGTTYMSTSQIAGTMKTFEQFADRQNQKVKSYNWYPIAQAANMRTGLYYEVVDAEVSSLEQACALPEAKYITTPLPADISEENTYKLAALLGFPGVELFVAPDVRWHDDYEGSGYGKLVNGDENGLLGTNSSYLRQIGFMMQPASDPYNYSGEDRYVHIINIGNHAVTTTYMDPTTMMRVEEGTEGAVAYEIDPIETTAKSAVMNANMRTLYVETDASGFFGAGGSVFSEISYLVDYDALVFFNQVTAGLPICMSDSTEQQIKLYPEQELSPYIGQDYNDQGDWENGNQAWTRSWLMEDRETAGTTLEAGTINANLLANGTVEAPAVFPSKEAFIQACRDGDINYMDLYASKGAIMPTEGIYSDANPDGRVELVVTNFDLVLVADKAYYR